MKLNLNKEVAKLIAKAAGCPVETALSSLSVPNNQFGDISSKISFFLAKDRGQNPAAIAAEILPKIKLSKNFSKVDALGPYINFYFSNEVYTKVIAQILNKKEKFGKGKKRKGKVMIEFPAVNPNKPWHMGHLRNALLGDSVARILEFSGAAIERIDYIDDLGLQVAQSLWGVINLKNTPSGKFDRWLGEQYVDVAKAFGEDQKVQESVRSYLHKIEEGNNEIADRGRALSEDCVKAQYETAFAYGVYHDALVFESDIMRELFETGLKMLKESNAIVKEKDGKNAGCWVVKLSDDFEKEFGKMTDPDKILIRSDGTATYTGKDVIFHMWKFGKLKKKFSYESFILQPNGKTAFKSSKKGKPMSFGSANVVINVIGQEQKYPQRVVAEVLRRLGFGSSADSLIHLAYEHVTLPEGKFSGRAGTWVGYTADDLYKEAQERVMEKIKHDLSAEERAAVARSVGAGAIKFSFLRTNADKKIVFKWDEALNMEGDSGPYVQYAYVRANGILKKSETKPGVAVNYSFNDSEKRLIRQMMLFPEIAEKSAKEFTTHYLPRYALDLASDFTSFYSVNQVLKAETGELVKTRLAIVLATKIVLGNALNLLGIDRLDKM